MSMDNHITLRGYVTAEPKFWQPVESGIARAEVRVGSTPRWLNRDTGEWQDGEPMYFTIKCWRNLAVNVKGSLHKGDMVIVRGKFISRTWVDDQQRQRVQIEVEADSVGHDLAFVWSFVNRGAKAPRNVAQSLANGEMARAGLDSPDGPDGPDGPGGVSAPRPDDLPPVPDEPGYPRDDYALGGGGAAFSESDSPGSPEDEETANGEAQTKLTAEAMPF